MLAALSAIIISIAAGITLFVQTITLSSCRRLQCCCGRCELTPTSRLDHRDSWWSWRWWGRLGDADTFHTSTSYLRTSRPEAAVQYRSYTSAQQWHEHRYLSGCPIVHCVVCCLCWVYCYSKTKFCPILSVLSTRFERWWCLGFYSIAIVKIKEVFLFSSYFLWTLGQKEKDKILSHKTKYKTNIP